MAETMVGDARLRNVADLCTAALRDGVPGDFIETGVWRGGVTILMRAVLAAAGDTDRAVWVADSFEGLPAPDGERYPADADLDWSGVKTLKVGADAVRANFSRTVTGAAELAERSVLRAGPALMVPSPASATRTIRSGRSQSRQVDAVAVVRDRGAGTADGLDPPDVGRGSAATTPARRRGRRASGCGSRPSASAAIGGAIGDAGTSGAPGRPRPAVSRRSPRQHRRVGGLGVSRVVRLRRLAGRHGQAAARAARDSPAADPRLADLGGGPVPTTTADVGHGADHQRPSSAGQPSRRPRVREWRGGAAHDAQPPRAGGDGGRTDGGDEEAALEQAAADGAARAPRRRARTGTIGDGWPGASRSTWARRRARRPRPPRSAGRAAREGGGGVAPGSARW